MLIPPVINYYSVDNPLNNSFLIDNKKADGTYNPVNLDLSETRVYLNGTELRRGFDYLIPLTATNTVKIDPSLLNVGDVVAILSKPGSAGGGGQQDYEYDLYNNNLILCASRVGQERDPSILTFNSAYAGWNTDWVGEIRVITYNNHDNLFMRTEVFDGNPSGRFKISRPVLDESYVWVSINGIPLANYLDFEILDDSRTIQISDLYHLTTNDVVTVVSFASNKTTKDILGFRVFKDMFNRTQYKRLSKQNSTYLTRSLADIDPIIYVKDASVLTQPLVAQNIPGSALITGERVEFFKVYSVVGSVQIANSGTNFVTNDTVTFTGTNWVVPLTATVVCNTLSNITGLTFTGGVYDGISIPSVITYSSTNGTGTGATFVINLVNNSALGQLRRGTLGTSPKGFSQIYSDVIDQGTVQTIPYGDRILKQNVLTTASLNTYVISTSSFNYVYNTDTISSSTWVNDGIVLSNIPNPVNQIDVYYGGRKLNKEYTYHQDVTVSYDSQEIRKILGTTQLNSTATVAGLPAQTANIGTAYVITTTNQVWVYENSLEENAVSGYVYRGLTRRDPEFTLNTSTQVLTLNIAGGVQEGIRLTVVKKQFEVNTLWNNNGVSLLDSNTNPAKFLQARPAELPDDQYY